MANHGTRPAGRDRRDADHSAGKLLRVLQEKEIERVGGVRPIPLDVRLVCSTNRDLAQMVHDGQFRADLYYRLNTMELVTPPLRDRLEDLPELCELFIKRTNQCNGLAITGIHPDVYRFFETYHWPGNVQELEHTLERAAVLLGYGELNVPHFDFLSERIGLQRADSPDLHSFTLKGRKDALERDAIFHAMQVCHGNKSAAAKLLEMDRTVLLHKIQPLPDQQLGALQRLPGQILQNKVPHPMAQ